AAAGPATDASARLAAMVGMPSMSMRSLTASLMPLPAGGSRVMNVVIAAIYRRHRSPSRPAARLVSSAAITLSYDRPAPRRPRLHPADPPGVGGRAYLRPAWPAPDTQADLQVGLDDPGRDHGGRRRDAVAS